MFTLSWKTIIKVNVRQGVLAVYCPANKYRTKKVERLYRKQRQNITFTGRFQLSQSPTLFSKWGKVRVDGIVSYVGGGAFRENDILKLLLL